MPAPPAAAHRLWRSGCRPCGGDVLFLLRGVDRIEHVDQQIEMKARGVDAPLRPVLAVHGDDLACRQRSTPIHAEQLPEMAIGNINKGSSEHAKEDEEHAERADRNAD